MVLITGPNASGKSVYMKQVGFLSDQSRHVTLNNQLHMQQALQKVGWPILCGHVPTSFSSIDDCMHFGVGRWISK
jgi:ABC-type Mn2+/Zn2+ transport system ATPase subunit